MDTIDKILSGLSPLPIRVATDSYLLEIVDRLGRRILTAVSHLPEVDAKAEDALEQEQEYQRIFQEEGAWLLPGMRVFVSILLKRDPAFALGAMHRLFTVPGATVYLDYMRQHTDLDKYHQRLSKR